MRVTTVRAAAALDRDPSRAHWMELFFDLIFVALIAQLAGGLHEEPTIGALATFTALFASVWWSWVNLTFTVNVMSWLTRRQLSGVMLAAMAAVGAIAVAAPEALGERAWLFAAGNAALRFILLGLWSALSWSNGRASRLRIFAYNGATGLLWFVSIWVPDPWNHLLWAAAIVFEVILLLTNSRTWPDRMLPRMNMEHLSERFGLLVVIVLGESVLATVVALSDAWTLASGVVAVLSLAALAALAWSFFMYGTEVMQTGLEQLQAAGRYRPIRDTIGFLPFPLIVGVTAISGALATAIHHPSEHLPVASAVSLSGGIAVFFLTNAAVSLRLGRPRGIVLRWAIPALLLCIVPGLAAFQLPAGWAILVSAVVLGLIVLLGEPGHRPSDGAPRSN